MDACVCVFSIHTRKPCLHVSHILTYPRTHRTYLPSHTRAPGTDARAHTVRNTAQGEDTEPALQSMEWYTAAVGTLCAARVPKEGGSESEALGGSGSVRNGTPYPPTGWCSWYEHMEK
eukprot:3757737-Rhodomonas_salina.1